jgi:eukaryotic-like serine/threonine-protein kinase
MSPQQAQSERLKLLFERALGMSAEERSRFLEEIRRQDEALGACLAELIAAQEQETEPMDQALNPRAAGAAPSFPNGTLIRNRFRIVRFLGRGGMGEVYEANDLELGRIALKTIRREIAGAPRTLLRFKQEVQLARMVTSPYVCRIHELYLEPAPFLTMEFLEGVTLAGQIEREGALPASQAETIALQLCAGLQAMHEAGVIHRDFKCQNVMLAPRRSGTQAVVMDLGLAREAAPQDGSGTTITAPGTVMGTTEYMAPEQFEGRPATPATDIYALGVVLYEMLTGTRPFHARTPLAAAIRRAQRRPPVSAVRPDLPKHWNLVIEKCLEYNAENRYQSAGEVAAALRQRPSRLAQARHAVGRASRLQRAAILLALMMLLGGAGAWLRYQLRGYYQPENGAQEWYNRGITALRDGTYLQATEALSRAVALDGDFALAHARLADAWAELNFTAKAQQELLRALEVKGRLPRIQQQYVDAVHATLTQQYHAAVRDYAGILRALPSAEKAYGYVDLARAQEKAGDISQALKCYRQAAALAPEYPASFVRLAILESRQGKPEAEAHFQRAEALYRAASNTEGLAEIDYQRADAASSRGDVSGARVYFEKSLRAAQEMQSAQLEIRVLTRMSALEYYADNTGKAIQLAQQAIQLARRKGIEYWATEGLIRLGNAYAGRREYAQAEGPIQEGLRLAQENGMPRLEALGRISLASIRDQQDKPAETITLAQGALDYYQKMGFFVMSTQALDLIVRSRKNRAEFKEALPIAREVLETTRKSNNPALSSEVEQLVGSVLLGMENYPEAWTHLEASWAGARALGRDVTYESVSCADVLWRLGRYAEAGKRLASIPPQRRSLVAASADAVRAEMALSQQKFSRALGIARYAQAAGTGATPADIMEFRIVSGFARAGLRAAKAAREDCQAALTAAQRENNPEMIARANLCAAAASLAAGSPQEARRAAEAAQHFFAGSRQNESEWRSLLSLAQACRSMGDGACSTTSSARAQGILSGLEQNWGEPVYQLYGKRPDVQTARRELAALTPN